MKSLLFSAKLLSWLLIAILTFSCSNDPKPDEIYNSYVNIADSAFAVGNPEGFEYSLLFYQKADSIAIEYEYTRIEYINKLFTVCDSLYRYYAETSNLNLDLASKYLLIVNNVWQLGNIDSDTDDGSIRDDSAPVITVPLPPLEEIRKKYRELSKKYERQGDTAVELWEMYNDKNEYKLALDSYKSALALDKNNTNAEKMLRRLK